MADWFVLMTPLAVLSIVLLFPFIGCGEYLSPNTSDETPPSPPASSPEDKEEGPPVIILPPIPPTAPPTRLQLNPSLDLNEIKAGGTDSKVYKITVTFTLSKKPGDPVPVVPKVITTQIVPIDPNRFFIEPAVDGSVIEDVPPSQVTVYTWVTCHCDVDLRETDPPDPDNPVFNAFLTEDSADLTPEKNHVFTLRPVWDDLGANPRVFEVKLQA